MPSASATPSAFASGSPVRVVSLPDSYREHRMSSDGPFVVLDEIGSADDALASSIVFVDLLGGKWRTLATAASGYHPWTPLIRGDQVAWVEWQYEQPPASGACRWRIVAMNTATGRKWIVASGVNTRLEGLGAPPPPIALDGADLAYAVQDTTASRPWGWRVKAVDLDSGQMLREIATDEEVYGFGLSGGSVAYSEGLVDSERGFVYRTRLMVSTTADPAPRQVAADAFEVSFRDGQLAWVADVESSQKQSGLQRTSRVWTATGPSWTPLAVTPQMPTATTEESWPAAAAGSVSFDESDVTNASRGVPTLWLWSARTGQAEAVPGSLGAILSSQGAGWLTWAGGLGDSVTVSGVAN